MTILFVEHCSILVALLLANVFAAEQSWTERVLSFEAIAGFSPLTKVTDYAAIDLDQQEIENHVGGAVTDYSSAELVYENGAHSRSYAVLQLEDRTPFALDRGARVVGSNENGDEVIGYILGEVEAGERTLSVLYETAETHVGYVGCQVGGSSNPNTAGCFRSEGSVSIGGTVNLDYIYEPDSGNLNGRTIKGFSVNSALRMRQNGDGAYYQDFQKFFNYYGAADYADRWVSAALTGSETRFLQGNADFKGFSDDGREEAIKRGTVYLNIFMFVLRELEDALDDCEQGCDIDGCNEDTFNSLDAAVALYTGSLQVTDGNDGIMLYDLAERRCINFNTCDGAISKVNQQIFTQFSAMQENLLSKSCSDARTNKERISQLMYVPIIQGTLLASYLKGQLGDISPRTEGRGATFAAAVVPMVHACDANDANTIFEHMKVGSTIVGNFSAVKEAFERNYACMGVTCEDVGGVWNRAQGQYFSGAAPCVDSVSPDTSSPTSPPAPAQPTETPLTAAPIAPVASPTSPSDGSPTVAPTPLQTQAPTTGGKTPLAGFQPKTNVQDHALIDLDQQKIQDQIALENLREARNIYQDGGHSKSFAVLTLLNPSPNHAFERGTPVFGWTEKSQRVFGSIIEDTSWEESTADSITIKVLYDILQNSEPCQSGGLFTIQAANREGCFADTGTIIVRPKDSNDEHRFSYTYDGRRDNDNARTIQEFSTSAVDDMQTCTEGECSYFSDFQLYADYYGSKVYANKWFIAAFRGETTGFQSERGDADFSALNSIEARGEAMQKGAVILNTWMAVVRELEYASDACRRLCTGIEDSSDYCNIDAPHFLDAAVAFYVGSLEGEDGSGEGVLLYDLADKYASGFRTNGPIGIESSGTSFVNLEAIRLFTETQKLLIETMNTDTDRCDEVDDMKQEIVNLMKVPLVQGTLQAAWKRSLAAEGDTEQNKAQGATFAASILPYVHDCRRSHASLIYSYLHSNSNSSNIDFPRVRDALEDIYECLGITCQQVGGIWNGESFEPGAEPCGSRSRLVNNETSTFSPTESPSAVSTSTRTVSHCGLYLFLVGICFVMLS